MTYFLPISVGAFTKGLGWEALGPDILAAIDVPAPADTMFGNEIRIAGNAQAVGIDHQVADRPGARHVDNGKNFRVDRRLAT